MMKAPKLLVTTSMVLVALLITTGVAVSQVIGAVNQGTDSTSNGDFSTVSGGRNNNIPDTGDFATIGGGRGNKASGFNSTIAGGEGNQANGPGSTVAGGGQFGGRGRGNIANGSFSTVGGGMDNEASGGLSTIGGGTSNTADGVNSTVSGGSANQARFDHATIGGGRQNTTSGTASTIGGGSGNRASALSTIGGGSRNTASGFNSTIGGGGLSRDSVGNTASGSNSTIGGGGSNQAGGFFSTIPGGRENSAQGRFSFAAGQRAKADHDGTFVWADSTTEDFASTQSNQFLIRASGGVGIGTDNPQEELDVNGTVIANQVVERSSKRWKTNIQPIEGALEKVQGLRGVSYDWKADGKHDIGLIAEEVGQIVPEVVTYEENGQDATAVEYARLVPVLIEAVKEQQKELDEKDAEISALQARMTTLEESMGSGANSTQADLLPLNASTLWMLAGGFGLALYRYQGENYTGLNPKRSQFM